MAETRGRGGHRPVLTGRGGLVLATGVLAVALGGGLAYSGLLGLGAALVALPAASLLSLRVAAPLEVAREVPARYVSRLADCATELRVRNTSARVPVNLVGTDHVDGVPVPVHVPVLGPGARAAVQSGIPTAWRGDVELGPLVLRRQGLLGLATTTDVHGQLTTITVVPRVLEVTPPSGGARRSHVGADERLDRGGTDLVGLREYVPGDDLRRLHWASSARAGSLMIREDADPAEPHLTVLVDDRAGSHDGHDLEESVDVAVSLVVSAARAGAPTRLVTWSGGFEHCLDGGSSDGGPREDDLALLRRGAAGIVTSPVETLEPAHGLQGGGEIDVLVVVTGRRARIEPVASFAARGLDGVVLVVDPAPDEVLGITADVRVVRGPRAEDLAHAWTRVVSR